MQIEETLISAIGKKYFIKENASEVAHGYLYMLKNDLHPKPFGFIEDVWVREEERGKGIGTQLVKHILKEAKLIGCYKVICTSRYEKPKVHALYTKLGFYEHGKEFRINFEEEN